jgi:hypothetical protein
MYARWDSEAPAKGGGPRVGEQMGNNRLPPPIFENKQGTQPNNVRFSLYHPEK